MASISLAATICLAAGPCSVLVASEVDLPSAAARLLSVECPDIFEQDENAMQTWHDLGILALQAQSLVYEDPRESLVAQLRILGSFISSYPVSVLYLCPASMMRHFKRAGDAALAAGEVARQRYLLQWGATWRLSALSRWYTRLQSNPKWTKETLPVEAMVFDPEYLGALDITLQSLHKLHGVKAKPLMRASEVGEVEVLAVCLYEDPRLPELASQNHGRYCTRRGYRYRQLRKVPEGEAGWKRLGDLPHEPHYWKIQQALDALEREDGPDWVLVIDCDAFFTNADVGVQDVAFTYGPSAAFFVAEDAAGINTGVMLFRRHDWTIGFLRDVLRTPFVHVWDQSQFLWQLLQEYGAFVPEVTPAVPPHIAPVHQSHLNAYHQGTADSWHAYAWKPGDFIIHYAGCPWDETFCWDKMMTSAHVIDDQLPGVSEHQQTEADREVSGPRGGSS
eukprot:TRINITY_DN11999_c0_g1_i2.p1 TRINITY_DN11999_c0_g1~~TRINITY_DN11999_c0_g1_i2.p1  ORF type:complete len:449 (-),score=64.46 TRINITY_DN11999_c0_g1_i2:75-1421(-)